MGDHCHFRNWILHAVNCRSNHVHVVVAADVHPKEVMRQLKYWATRRLNEMGASREAWWAELGSGRDLNDEVALVGAIIYTLEAQDRK
ncbi:transposase [Blastopirellula retiformator]|uniref:transposase n=1 Tax=Blastopirellula retiformator TaxID=2527970 RepID=UPI001FEA67D7|nr:transposase [Blastopirellula retiformator]